MTETLMEQGRETRGNDGHAENGGLAVLLRHGGNFTCLDLFHIPPFDRAFRETDNLCDFINRAAERASFLICSGSGRLL